MDELRAALEDTEIAGIRGESHVNSVLSEEDVREIRKLYESTDISQQSLASKFDVSKGTIQNIVQGKTWTHVEP